MSHLTVQQLSSSLDGAVTGPSLELIVRHLAGCAECRDRQSRLARHDDVLRRLLAPEASAEFLETLGSRGEDIAVAIARGVPPPEMTTTVPLLDDEDPHAPSEPRPAERPELGLSGQIAQEAGFGRIGVKPTVPTQPPESDPEEAKRWLEALEKGVPEDVSAFTVLQREKSEPDGPQFDLPAWIKERATRTRPMPSTKREVQKLKLVFDTEPSSASVVEPESEPVQASEPETADTEAIEVTEVNVTEVTEVKAPEPEGEEAKPSWSRALRLPWFAKRKPAPEPEPTSASASAPEPVKEPEPIVARTPEPEPVKEPEPIVAHAPEPEPVKEPEPIVARTPEPAPIVAHAPEPVKESEPIVARRPEPSRAKDGGFPNWTMPRLVRDPEPKLAPLPEPEPVRAPEPLYAQEPKPERTPEPKYSRMPELLRFAKAAPPIAHQEEEPMTPQPRGSTGEPYRGSAPYEPTPTYPPQSYEPASGTYGDSFDTDGGADAFDDSGLYGDPAAYDAAYGAGEPVYATRERARAAALRRAHEEARRRGLRVHWFLAGGSVGTLLLVVVSLQLMPVTREGDRVASRFQLPRIELLGRDSTAAPTPVNGAPELHSATTPAPVESVVPPAPREVPQDSSAMAPEDTSADSTDKVPGR